MSNLVETDMIYISKTKQIRQCKNCKHKITYRARMPFVLCDWCGSKIYKNDKIEFKEKLMKEMGGF